MMKTISRNNLWVPPGDGGRVWTGRDITENPAHADTNSPPQWEPGWNTDVDYDGFDWGDSNVAFSWRNFAESYPDVQSFYMGVGIEEHGVAVDKDVIFEDYFVPTQDGVSVPRRMLTLVSGTNAVDRGGVLPNLADVYDGAAPDLGAHELGQPLPHFGPRTAEDMTRHRLYWAFH